MNPKSTLRLLWGSFFLLTAYWAFRFHGHFPAFMDTLLYTFPEKWFNVECWRAWRLPLWNPYLDCGIPHLANLQSAPFYPFFWPWAFTGLTDWFFLVALLHGVLGAVGFTFWLRALKVPDIPASLCGMGFGASALLVHYWGFPTHLASLSWIPWIFWGSLQLFQRPTWGAWSLLVFFGSCQVLAGYPFFTFYMGILLPAFLWVKLRPTLRQWGLQASVWAAVLALTAAQWLPFLDFLGYLHRSGAGEQTYSLKWVDLLTLLQPNLLGTPGTKDYLSTSAVFIFNNFYLGLVPLGLLLWSYFSKVARDGFWKWSALAVLLWTLGVHFPLWRVLPDAWLSGLEPAKSSFLFLFCALTAVGLFLKEKGSSLPKKNSLWKAAWVLGLLWTLDLATVPSRVLDLVPDPYREASVIQASKEARLWAGEGRMVSLREAGALYPSGPGSRADSMRMTAEVLFPNVNLVFGLKSARGHLSIQLDGHQNLSRYVEMGHPFDGRILDAAGAKLFLLPDPLAPFKYSVHEKKGNSVFARNAGAMASVWEAGQVREFPGRKDVFQALLDPRAFLEDEVFLEKDGDKGAVRLLPSRRVLREGRSTLWGRLGSWADRLYLRQTEVGRSRPSPCEALFEVTPPGRGNFLGLPSTRPSKPRLGGAYSPSAGDAGRWLVFGESWAPGWKAWVNGIPKPIFRSYGLFMAVPVPGRDGGRVVFRYEPTAFRLGLFLSLLALAGWVLGFILNLRQRGWTASRFLSRK